MYCVLVYHYTVGVTKKLPLPFCNYRSNGGKTVNGILFAARRNNVERALLKRFALINGILLKRRSVDRSQAWDNPRPISDVPGTAFKF